VLLLIVLGFVLKTQPVAAGYAMATAWNGSLITYCCLVLVVQTLLKADLGKVPVAGVGGALFISALLMALLCLGLPAAASPMCDRRTGLHLYLSGAQTRWQTYVALAVSGKSLWRCRFWRWPRWP